MRQMFGSKFCQANMLLQKPRSLKKTFYWVHSDKEFPVKTQFQYLSVAIMSDHLLTDITVIFTTHKPRQSLLALCARLQPASSGSHSSPWCRGCPCTECVGSSPGPVASWTWPAACCTGGGCAGHLTPRPTDSSADTHRRGSRTGELGEFGPRRPDEVEACRKPHVGTRAGSSRLFLVKCCIIFGFKTLPSV